MTAAVDTPGGGRITLREPIGGHLHRDGQGTLENRTGDGKRKLFSPQLVRQLLRFAVVGFSAFLIDYGFLYVFTDLCGIDYLVSSAFSFSLSVIFNYIMSVVWVFDVGKDRSKGRDFIVFVALSAVGLLINQGMMWAGVELLPWPEWLQSHAYLIVKLFATAVVMVWNFITRKLFLERKNS